MNDINDLFKSNGKGGYIFISHSHLDIKKVRSIRNRLENMGFDPLCFYLKCLEKDDEIFELIKREIDAREWFLYADSENSRNSEWVKREREYIKSTNRKKIINIDLSNEEDIENKINGIRRYLRVYVSYHISDKAIARRIYDKLIEKDYLCCIDENFDLSNESSDYVSQMTQAIIEASREGFVLALLSPQAMESQYLIRTINYAFANGGIIVPVALCEKGSSALSANTQYYLNYNEVNYLGENPTDRDIEELIDRIGSIFVVNNE